MTLADPHAVSADGRIMLFWRRVTTIGTITVEVATNPFFIGVSTVVSGLATTEHYDHTLTNDTTPRYYRITDGNSTVTTVDAAYAAQSPVASAVAFYDAQGWPVVPVGAGRKVWFIADGSATPAGNNANTGLSIESPKLSWDDTGGNGVGHNYAAQDGTSNWRYGDAILAKRGSTFTRRFMQAFMATGTWPDNCPSVYGAYGPLSSAMPIFTGATDGSHCFDWHHDTGGTGVRGNHAVMDLNLDCDIAARGTTDSANGVNLQTYLGVGNNGGAVLISGCWIRRWFFGVGMFGNAGGGNGARPQNITLWKTIVKESLAHGDDTGTQQQPSGVIVGDCDNVTIDGGAYIHNGYDENSGDMPLGSGAAGVTYDNLGGGGNGRITDAGKAWTVNAFQNHHVHFGTNKKRIASNDATHLILAEAIDLNGYAMPGTGTAYHIPYSCNSQYRHSIYIQRTCTNVVLRGFINTHNMAMSRSGGVLDKILNILCPIGMSSEGSYSLDHESTFSPASTTITDCWTVGSMEIVMQATGGFAAWMGNNDNNRDIGAVSLARLGFDGRPIAGYDYGAGQLKIETNNSGTTHLASLSVVDLFMNQWRCNGIWFQRPTRTTGNWVSQRNVLGASTPYLGVDGAFGTDDATFGVGGTKTVDHNTYYDQANTGNPFYLSGHQNQTTWNAATGDTNSTVVSTPPVPTADRTIEHSTTSLSYDFLVSGGTNNTIAHYLAQAALNRHGSEDVRYTAAPTISWIRQGSVNLVAAFTALTAPFIPTIGVTSSPTSGSLVISWTDNSSDETGFNARWSTDQVNWTVQNDIAGVNGSSGTVTGLPASTLIYIQVQSKNAIGASDWSGTATGTTSANASGGPPKSHLIPILKGIGRI